VHRGLWLSSRRMGQKIATNLSQNDRGVGLPGSEIAPAFMNQTFGGALTVLVMGVRY